MTVPYLIRGLILLDRCSRVVGIVLPSSYTPVALALEDGKLYGSKSLVVATQI